MDGGQARPNAARAAAKPPQGLSASALERRLGLRRRAREDAARNLPRHDAADLSEAEKAVIEAPQDTRTREFLARTLGKAHAPAK